MSQNFLNLFKSYIRLEKRKARGMNSGLSKETNIEHTKQSQYTVSLVILASENLLKEFVYVK